MSHPRPAPFKLDVIIVGGSIAGLSMAIGLALTGHSVRVLEKSPSLGSPPGGLRLTPNVTKILVQWGLEDELSKKGTLVREGTRFWNFPVMLLITHPVETGELIGYLDWAEPVIQDIGAMFCMIRFSDIQDILYAAAVRAGAQVIFDTKVSFADSPCPSEPSGNSSSLPSCERPSVHLSDGTVLQADMIIGADGQHSTVRSSVQEEDVKPKRTDTIVLSGNVPMKDILEDDVLKTQRVAYGWVFWLGPRRCFMGHPISLDSEYAVILFWDHYDLDVPEGWIPNVPVESLKLANMTSDIKLSRMFEKIDSFCWQRYLEWPEIENWSDDSSRIVLIGEASHPLLPCSTQSCGLSVEAAAVLSTLLSYVRGFDHIPLLVEAYETIRQGRSKFLHEVELASITQTMFPPGPERDARDLEMQKLLHAGQDRWGDDAYLGVWGQLCEVWAYNAFDAADDWWVQWGVLREHSLRRQKSNVEAPFSPLEISVGTGYDD